MNSLSWMIYLAEVAGNVGTFLAVSGVILLILAGLAFMIGAIVGNTEPVREADRQFQREVNRKLARYGWVPALAIFLSTFIPSQSTIYAIAASEMGETALNTETGGKAVQALNAWLDRQIGGKGD